MDAPEMLDVLAQMVVRQARQIARARFWLVYVEVVLVIALLFPPRGFWARGLAVVIWLAMALDDTIRQREARRLADELEEKYPKR